MQWARSQTTLGSAAVARFRSVVSSWSDSDVYAAAAAAAAAAGAGEVRSLSVSYTHLTLPTILRV